MVVDKSELFSGNNWGDIFCYVSTSSDGWSYIFMLMSIYIIFVSYGLIRQYDKELTFLTAAIVNFSLATILIISNSQVGCSLLSEEAYITIVIIFIGTIIAYVYNKPENS